MAKLGNWFEFFLLQDNISLNLKFNIYLHLYYCDFSLQWYEERINKASK